MKDVYKDIIDKEDIQATKEWMSKNHFFLRKWIARDALKHQDGTLIEFINQEYDSTEFTHIKDGWTEDRCELCLKSIYQGQWAMTPDDRNWLCCDCYQTIISDF